MTKFATAPHNYPFSPTNAIKNFVFFWFLYLFSRLTNVVCGRKMSGMQGSPGGLRVPVREIVPEDPLNLRRFTPAEGAASRDFFDVLCPFAWELFQGC